MLHWCNVCAMFLMAELWRGREREGERERGRGRTGAGDGESEGRERRMSGNVKEDV